ncbi:hypothetical protein JCM9534A_46510 [Catenuloplanes indicus JCM 9534]
MAGSRRVPADPSEPRIGDVLLLADADYKFGTGPLVIEVQAIRSRGTLPDGTWWRIEGLCRHARTDPGGLRTVDVRANAIPAARAAGAQPPG